MDTLRYLDVRGTKVTDVSYVERMKGNYMRVYFEDRGGGVIMDPPPVGIEAIER
jgi:hypothetical protein